MIDLEARDLAILLEILVRLSPGLRVKAFGSRVQGRAKRFSDLDLVLEGQGTIPWAEISELKESFACSDLEIMVDLIDLNNIDPAFRRIIETQPTVLLQGGSLA